MLYMIRRKRVDLISLLVYSSYTILFLILANPEKQAVLFQIILGHFVLSILQVLIHTGIIIFERKSRQVG